jgi:hypothetical protein
MMAPFDFAFGRWRRYGAVRLRRVHFLLTKEGLAMNQKRRNSLYLRQRPNAKSNGAIIEAPAVVAHRRSVHPHDVTAARSRQTAPNC